MRGPNIQDLNRAIWQAVEDIRAVESVLRECPTEYLDAALLLHKARRELLNLLLRERRAIRADI